MAHYYELNILRLILKKWGLGYVGNSRPGSLMQVHKNKNYLKILSFKYCTQSHYKEVAQGSIVMEQKLRFGMDLGRLAILTKKLGLIMSNSWGRLFHVFVGNFFALKSCIITFYNFFYTFLNRLNIHNQLCIALLETLPRATSI